MINRCAIIGLGLIGGSLALALNERKLVKHICGVDTNPQNLELALAGKAVHETAGLKKAVVDADVVILATPVGAMPAILREISPFLKPGSVVTDVGSTKKTVIEEAEKVLGPGHCFVG